VEARQAGLEESPGRLAQIGNEPHELAAAASDQTVNEPNCVTWRGRGHVRSQQRDLLVRI
jgi:hypothetical protein